LFFAEVLIHSLVKSSRIVFCDCFENEKLTRLPSYLVESVTTEKRSSALGPLHQEQTLPINSHVLEGSGVLSRGNPKIDLAATGF
jgi:hypothetical protein